MMSERLYSIYDGNHLVARNMTLDTAIILLRALCESYWGECELSFLLVRESSDMDAQEVCQ